MTVKALRESIYHYQDYTVWRFMHYFQQIHHVLKLKPGRVLEIGPGDHTVTDFLRRKGIAVKTFDNDENLFPDYLGDIREELKINEQFDLVLASEVFEHMNIKWLEKICENIKKIIVGRGYMVVSLPYSTIRLFPERSNYGKFVSCEGRLYTYIPYYYVQPILTLLRGIYRIAVKRSGLRDAFEYYTIPEYPDNKFDVHHWDLDFDLNTRKTVEKIFAKHFTIVEEKTYINTNCVFYILKKDHGGNPNANR